MMAEALEKAGRLGALATAWCFTANEMRWAQKIAGLGSRAQKRASPVRRARLIRSAAADLRIRMGRWWPGPGFHQIDRAFARVDRLAARELSAESAGVLAREDGCRASFEQALQLDLPRLYVLPTAHFSVVEKLLRHEQAQFPEAFVPGTVERDFAPERLARKRAELDLATKILCPSSFVRNSVEMSGGPAEKLTTSPLGTDTRWAAPGSKQAQRREPVVLYAGNVSARKGVHRLVLAWKRMKGYRTHRLRLVGQMDLPERFVAEHHGMFEHVPRMARDDLMREYAGAQAFAFNALADGFGHVFAEAMLAGTPVLASRNCGAPDLISHGQEGLLFEFGNEEQLCGALDWALTHPGALAEMGSRARERALTWGWREFQEAFLDWTEAGDE